MIMVYRLLLLSRILRLFLVIFCLEKFRACGLQQDVGQLGSVWLVFVHESCLAGSGLREFERVVNDRAGCLPQRTKQCFFEALIEPVGLDVIRNSDRSQLFKLWSRAAETVVLAQVLFMAIAGPNLGSPFDRFILVDRHKVVSWDLIEPSWKSPTHRRLNALWHLALPSMCALWFFV